MLNTNPQLEDICIYDYNYDNNDRNSGEILGIIL